MCSCFVLICLFTFICVSLAGCASGELEYMQTSLDGLRCWKVVGIGDCTYKNIRIPEVYNGYEVAYIRNLAFAYNSHIKSVTIPETVVQIESRAFVECSSLKEVNIQQPRTSLEMLSYYYSYFGDYCFASCTRLEKIKIPENVNVISEGAFFNCSSLKSVTLPRSLTFVKDYAFTYCDSLETVYYTGTYRDYKSIKIGEVNECLLRARVVFI